MKRRDFLKASAGITGTVLPVLSWGQAAPCPPPSFGVAGGVSTTSNCGNTSGGALPSLKLTSGAAAGVRGWTVGHAFKKGDAPNSVTAAGESIQCDVRNRWNDGSVKFAVLSGVSSFSPSRTIQLAAGASSAGAAIPEGQVLTALGSGDAVVTLGTYGSVSLKSLVGSAMTTSANTPGRVRTASSGPVMSEFHYMGIPSGGDPHLRVWFYVRVYANNDMEVETVVENGWFRVANPGERVYSPTVSIAGRTVFSSGALTHRHHTRWSRVDWVGSDPGVTPLHDASYLRTTGLVPNYGWGSPSSTVLDGLFKTANPAPFTELGNYIAGYYSGGDKDQIGILPNWAALWAAASTFADARAVQSVLANARIPYRYSNFYRDETTLRPPKMATNAAYAKIGVFEYGNVAKTGQAGVGNSLEYLPAVTGSDFPVDQRADRAHSVQDFYAAYLITGRWSLVDAQQSKTLSYNVLTGSTGRNYNDCLYSGNETRGRGWVLRDSALTLSMTPDSDAFRGELQVIWQNNMAWLRSTYATPGSTDYETAGWFGHISATGGSAYGDYGATKGGAYWWDAPWMHWFNVSALAWARDLEVPASSQATSDLATCLAHYSKICAGQAGDSTGFNYRRAAQYALPVGTDGGSMPLEAKYSWAQIYDVLQKELAIPALPAGTSLLSNTNTELTTADFDCSGSNFGSFVAALAAAAKYDAACLAGYRRIQASSTWPSRTSAWNNVPKAGIVPRV